MKNKKRAYSADGHLRTHSHSICHCLLNFSINPSYDNTHTQISIVNPSQFFILVKASDLLKRGLDNNKKMNIPSRKRFMVTVMSGIFPAVLTSLFFSR